MSYSTRSNDHLFEDSCDAAITNDTGFTVISAHATANTLSVSSPLSSTISSERPNTWGQSLEPNTQGACPTPRSTSANGASTSPSPRHSILKPKDQQQVFPPYESDDDSAWNMNTRIETKKTPKQVKIPRWRYKEHRRNQEFSRDDIKPVGFTETELEDYKMKHRAQMEGNQGIYWSYKMGEKKKRLELLLTPCSEGGGSDVQGSTKDGVDADSVERKEIELLAKAIENCEVYEENGRQAQRRRENANWTQTSKSGSHSGTRRLFISMLGRLGRRR